MTAQATATYRRKGPGGDLRGSSKDRAARRAYLLRTHGDGQTCPCHFCGVDLTDATITVDRIIPGCEGGRYTRDNIRPACGPCNSEDGNLIKNAGTRKDVAA
jgi:5-methylcytosine-specific restriction endonuclease McrA